MTNASYETTAQLIESIDALKDEVQVLRDAVDELRSELQWLCNNAVELTAERRSEIEASGAAAEQKAVRQQESHTPSRQQDLW